MAMFTVGNASSSPIILEFEIESVSMEGDTGAALSIMYIHHTISEQASLSTNVNYYLENVQRKSMKVLKSMYPSSTNSDHHKQLPLIIEGDRPSLQGIMTG